jgi:4-amino-4-deoxy-L-arabinose transferase-like glycosyltransferase
MLKKFNNYILFWKILLGLIWLAIIIIVNPTGEFPLNDDWAYSKSVLHLANTGQYVLIDWPAMSLIAQIYWGGLFCAIFGFSFTVLRISTLLLGFVGILFLFKLIHRTSDNRILAFIGALLLMINPLYVLLSFSFMTDVPFTACCILAIYSFSQHFKNEKNTPLIAGLVFSVIAVLIRQIGLLVPFSFAIVYIAAGKINVRLIIKGITPFIISMASLSYYNHWLVITNRMKPAYQTNGNIKTILVQFTQPFTDTLHLTFLRTGDTLFYCAIFLLPLLMLITPDILRKQISLKRPVPVCIAGFFMVVFFFVFKPNLFDPFSGNALYNFGMGPKLLKDSYNLHLNVTPMFGNSFWIMISIIGLAAMYMLILALSDTFVELIIKIKNKELDFKWKTVFLIYVISFIYLGFLVFSYFFDRYFIFLMPAIIFILLFNYGNKVGFKKKWMLMVVSILSFIVIGWFSISATHDYLSWNRARWKAIDYLSKDKKITPDRIDGGFEFNCWHQAGPWRPMDDSISWWCVKDDEYIVSFGSLAKYKTLKKFNYPSMIPCNDNNIYVLQRDTIAPEMITCDLEQFTDDEKNITTSSKEYQIPINNLLSSEKSHSGKYSLKFTTKDTYGFQWALKHVLPGDLIDIQIWKLGQNDVRIAAGSLNGNKFFFINNNTNCKIADEWKRFSLKFYAPDNVKDDIVIFLWCTQNGIAYIDDMTIKVYHKNNHSLSDLSLQ